MFPGIVKEVQGLCRLPVSLKEQILCKGFTCESCAYKDIGNFCLSVGNNEVFILYILGSAFYSFGRRVPFFRKYSNVVGDTDLLSLDVEDGIKGSM